MLFIPEQIENLLPVSIGYRSDLFPPLNLRTPDPPDQLFFGINIAKPAGTYSPLPTRRTDRKIFPVTHLISFILQEPDQFFKGMNLRQSFFQVVADHVKPCPPRLWLILIPVPPFTVIDTLFLFLIFQYRKMVFPAKAVRDRLNPPFPVIFRRMIFHAVCHGHGIKGDMHMHVMPVIVNSCHVIEFSSK